MLIHTLTMDGQHVELRVHNLATDPEYARLTPEARERLVQREWRVRVRVKCSDGRTWLAWFTVTPEFWRDSVVPVPELLATQAMEQLARARRREVEGGR